MYRGFQGLLVAKVFCAKWVICVCLQYLCPSVITQNWAYMSFTQGEHWHLSVFCYYVILINNISEKFQEIVYFPSLTVLVYSIMIGKNFLVHDFGCFLFFLRINNVFIFQCYLLEYTFFSCPKTISWWGVLLILCYV